MAKVRLLPGEKELVRLRPTPLAWSGRYLLALGWIAWGAALLWAPWLRDQDFLVRTLLVFGGPALVSLLCFLPARRHMRLALGVLAAASCAMVAIARDAQAMSAALALAGAMALVLVESDRRVRTYHLTNLRVLHVGGLWHKAPWTVHYDAILDVDARQSPFGRALGYGTLVPVLSAGKPVVAPRRKTKAKVAAVSDVVANVRPRLDGVGPLPKVQQLLAAFVQDATANDYLRAEQATPRKVAQAIQALGSTNLLR